MAGVSVTRMIFSVLVGLSFSLAAHAESKRYLVMFKNSQAFHQVAQAYKSGSTPMNFKASPKSVQFLEKVELMVVEANSQELQALEESGDVARIEEEQFRPLPDRISTFAKTAPFSIRKNDMERPWGIDAVKAPGAWNITKGAGVKVAVVDTGIDVNHPAVKGRLVAARNFASTNPEDYSDVVGHGTHVAGTILADGLNGGLVGVAPEAELFAARVCGALGCSTVGIAQGVDWAISQGANVINMSLGGPFMTFGEKAVYDKAEQQGVTIVAASGNDGQPKVSFPAAYTSILSVGATNPDSTKAVFSNWGPELDVVAPGVDVVSSVPVGTGRVSEVEVDFGSGLEILKSTSFSGSPAVKVQGLSMVYVGLGKAEDFAGKNLAGKVALIQRGEITFAEKAQTAIQAGAAAVMIFNNAPGLIQGALTDDGSELAVPVVMIEQVPGNHIVELLAASTDVTTSMGVVPSDYAGFQGTSMASPHVAGVAALVKAANPALTPAQIRAIIIETATALTPNDQNQMGAGLVNAELAVQRAQSGILLGRVVGL